MASCTVCSHLGDWRKTDVRQACVSVSPVVLENWPVGHGVCVQREKETSLPSYTFEPMAVFFLL